MQSLMIWQKPWTWILPYATKGRCNHLSKCHCLFYRKDVEVKLFQYIEENNLLSLDGRLVRPDEKLKPVFGTMEKGIAEIFNIFKNNLKNVSK